MKLEMEWLEDAEKVMGIEVNTIEDLFELVEKEGDLLITKDDAGDIRILVYGSYDPDVVNEQVAWATCDPPEDLEYPPIEELAGEE